MSKLRGILSDTDTGEVKWNLVAVPGQPIKVGGWCMTFMDGAEQLAEARLSGRTYAVFLWLISRLDFENYLRVVQKDCAQSLRMQESAVSAAIRELVAMKVLERGPRVGGSWTYRMSPWVAWRGKVKNLKTAQREAEKKHLKVLHGGQDKQG